MKVFFEDDMLVTSGYLPVSPDYFIDAKIGFSNTLAQLEMIYTHNPNSIVYTNSLATLMHSKFFWNKEIEKPELYIRSGEHCVFTRIDTLTERELKESHNYLHLYVNNEFNNLS